MANSKLTSWRKSSYSDDNGDCVEVAVGHRVIGVRDTKQHGNGITLEFPHRRGAPLSIKPSPGEHR